MREIKFRAWDNKRKSMVYQGSNTDKENGWVLAQFIFDELDIGLVVTRYGGEAEDIMDFELMQYTGYKDEKSTEIYEGDKLLITVIDEGIDGTETVGVATGIVEWYEAQWIINSEDYGFDDDTLDDWCLGDVVVIGNMYEEVKNEN